MTSKLKYFQEGSYNYSKFPGDIITNSILERYNKNIKNDLGEKRTCIWVKLMNFINKETILISDLLGKNENLNVLYEMKHNKFGKSKYNNKYEENKEIIKIKKEVKKNYFRWLIQKKK